MFKYLNNNHKSECIVFCKLLVDAFERVRKPNIGHLWQLTLLVSLIAFYFSGIEVFECM